MQKKILDSNNLQHFLSDYRNCEKVENWMTTCKTVMTMLTAKKKM